MGKKGTYAEKIGRIFFKIILFILLSVCVITISIMIGLTLAQSSISLKNEVTSLTGSIDTYMAGKVAVVDAVAATISSERIEGYDNQLTYVDSIKAMDNSVSAVYIAYPDESLVYSGGWLPDPDFVLTNRIWYTGAASADDVYITEPYVDETTGSICITLSKAVRIDGKLVNVVGMDLYLDDIVALISDSFNGSSYTFLTTAEDVILAHPNDAYRITADASFTLSDADGGRYRSLIGTEYERKLIWDYSGGPKVMMAGRSLYGWQIVAVRPLLSTLSLAIIIFLVNVAIFLLSVYISNRFCKWAVAKWFTPIYSISKKVTQMAEGDLSVAFDEEPITDEIDALTNALNTTITQLHAYIEDIRHVVSNVALGNLTVHQHVIYSGDFIAIRDALNNILDTLNTTLTDIADNSRSVADYSSQVQQSTEQVAEGATAQSLSISGLRDNIMLLSDKLRLVEENAEQAADVSKSANAKLTDGDRKMQELIDAMKRINETSDQIGSIVNTINDLAAQTNLLSLNASIEAARAGEAGRGFAVVADEISKLANASASASNTINALIESSKAAVQAGMQMADETAAALKSGVENFLVSEKKLLEITESVKEQSIAIDSISENAEQISTVIETTAASSEENAAISSEMIQKAHALTDSVNHFKLKE
ncbi:MAG: methyl-accepting chemotaxis protein [Lachnospiraceae bacterium]|nr:methyl-accepting chemotaxis protein [Lachnospiraceae bacterium]